MTDLCMKSFGLLSSCFAVDCTAARVQLVASIPGLNLWFFSFECWDLIIGEWSLRNAIEREQFGFLRLRKLVRAAGWCSLNNRSSQIVIQSGSIGSDFCHQNFFDDFMLSLGAADVTESFESQQHESSDEEDNERGLDENPLLGPEQGRYPANLAIFFPSRTVGRFNEFLYKRYTKRDPDIHCTVSSWHSLSYPTSCFHEMLPPGAAGKRREVSSLLLLKSWNQSNCCKAARLWSSSLSSLSQQVCVSHRGWHARGAAIWTVRCVHVCGKPQLFQDSVGMSIWQTEGGAQMQLSRARCAAFDQGRGSRRRFRCFLLLVWKWFPPKAWRAALPFDLAAKKYNMDDQPYSTHQQHVGSGYARADSIAKCKNMVSDFVQLGFADEIEVMECLMKANGDGTVALKMLRIRRSLE
jgi:hypothetical protein